MRLRAFAILVPCAAFVALVSGCSALLDWNGYTGAGTDPFDAGTLDDGAPHTIYGVTCGTDKRCAPVPPASWNGPVALYDGPSSAPPPACSDPFASAPVYAGHGGLTAPPATCSDCACAAPTGTTCSSPVLTFYSDNACGTACGPPTALDPAACVTPPGSCRAFQVTASAPTGGGCKASGGDPAILPASFSRTARACAPAVTPDQGTCRTNELCLPSPAPPFEPRFCVSQTGVAAACPGAPYTDGPHVYYGDGITDTRACSACACGGVTGAECTLSVAAGFRYLDPSCGTTGIPFAVPTSCAAFQGGSPFRVPGTPELKTVGTCPPTGGAPIGAATGTAPVTFCCTP